MNGDALIPDGASIVMACRKLKAKSQPVERIAGWDLFTMEMERLNRKGGKCFFMGSSEKVLGLIREKAKTVYPNIQIETYSPPYKPEFSKEDNDAIIEAIFDFEPNPEFPKECPYLGKPQEVEGYLSEQGNTHLLFCCLPSKDHVIIRSIIDYCENHLVYFYSVPNIYNYLHNRVYFNMMGNVPYLSLRPDPLSRTENKMLKRAFDIVFSLCFLCTLFIPIFIIVAIVTKITMPGPIFFK